MNTPNLVAKLWSLCNLLRDDGVTYHEYITELTYLVFLKMVEETGQDELLPADNTWTDLENQNAASRLEFYKKMLIDLGGHGSRITQTIYNNAHTVIRKPATLDKLVTEIDKLDWYSARQEGLGDMYEGLLEINASEKKSGAGQYFTPRVLINAMVELMKPTLDDVIVDPTAGTGGFLISAHHHIGANNDVEALDEAAYDRYQHKTFYGMEFVPDTRRLALMNLMLHDIAIDDHHAGILFGDTLSNEGKQLPKASLLLANPPFGTKQGGGIPTRDDLLFYSSNKQLAFLHLMYHVMLKPGGRAAVVLPDNVLFEAGQGAQVRHDLMEKCNLHTILRLPTGIFYAAGVKTNVLFFSKPEDPTQDKGNTQNVWVYDLRTNMPSFGKRTPFTDKYLEPFEAVFGDDPNGQSPRQEGEWSFNAEEIAVDPDATDENQGVSDERLAKSRWRCFSREWIRDTKGDSLDISWLKDSDSVDAADLPEPSVLAGEAMSELVQAMGELDSLMRELGAEEEADGTRILLKEVLGEVNS
ncbi:class I SAM-dependent DNA methyltransferase [Halomonas sp. GT]|uniref:class I SAM-dependent DNA methyltransferase n=1 Tax=Halomonas sp. GT TaxID=1971364 RepID=UPI0009F3E120|nr:N-6 DNA methylase [Halomonas sp. GT]